MTDKPNKPKGEILHKLCDEILLFADKRINGPDADPDYEDITDANMVAVLLGGIINIIVNEDADVDEVRSYINKSLDTVATIRENIEKNGEANCDDPDCEDCNPPAPPRIH